MFNKIQPILRNDHKESIQISYPFIPVTFKNMQREKQNTTKKERSGGAEIGARLEGENDAVSARNPLL